MIYGCLQPRELWFIDFNHVHVHVYGILYMSTALTIDLFVCCLNVLSNRPYYQAVLQCSRRDLY